MHYDKDGSPVDLLTWARLLESPGYKRVASDIIGPYWVSTVWLGLDHGIGAPPLIFETLVFEHEAGADPELVDQMDRYATLAEAEAGHKAMVARVRQACRKG